MSKVEMNNEIILLRQPVRQARICVINKLIREAKKLRNKQGNEKQMEKNKKKADRLLKEVYALKLIKDDDISKFGILQSDKLRGILQDPSADEKKRVMAKVAQYKTLSTRIVEFKEKFPDYETHLASKKKKQKPSKEAPKKRNLRDSQASSERKTEETQKRVPDLDSEEGASSTQHVESDAEEKPQQKMRLRERKRVSQSSEEVSDESPSKSLDEEAEKRPERDKSKAKKPRSVQDAKDAKDAKTNGETTSFKVIGEEATVKRFTDILRETDTADGHNREETEKSEATKDAKPVERRTDNFFMNPDDDPAETTSMDLRPRLRAREEEGNHHREAAGNFPRRQSGRTERKFFSSTEIRYRGREKRKNHDNARTRGPPVADVSKQKRKKFEVERKSKTKDFSGTAAEDNESLHPSWAARKKQQEILKQGFQGKKIVFDED